MSVISKGRAQRAKNKRYPDEHDDYGGQCLRHICKQNRFDEPDWFYPEDKPAPIRRAAAFPVDSQDVQGYKIEGIYVEKCEFHRDTKYLAVYLHFPKPADLKCYTHTFGEL
jgi:hypothetical protein